MEIVILQRRNFAIQKPHENKIDKDFEVIDTNPQGNGYPEITFEEFIEHKIELILLTSEPHNFTDEEGKSIAEEIVTAGGLKPTVVHIDGEDLTWFGARTAPALARLAEFCHQTLDTMKHQYDV